MRGKILHLSAKEATDFLLPRHYSGRIPNIVKAFGWEVDGKLQAVVTFGKPASPCLCRGICGEKWAKSVYELNRLCREEDFDEPLSQFVSAVLRRLRAENWIIVSYSDTAMHHNGYIYQACNFLYTGKTRERTDIYAGEGKHSRHYDEADAKNDIRVLRSAKHRYVFFCTRDRRLREQWQKALNYPIVPYPKQVNQHYVLGEYIKPILIDRVSGTAVNDRT